MLLSRRNQPADSKRNLGRVRVPKKNKPSFYEIGIYNQKTINSEIKSLKLDL